MDTKVIFEVVSSDVKAPVKFYIAKDGLRHCTKCHEPIEYRKLIAGVIHTAPILCRCERERLEQKKVAELKEHARYRSTYLRRAGFPDQELAKYTFAADDNKNQRLKKAMQAYVHGFSEFYKQGQGLLLYGGIGTGKTFAAAEIANALIDKGIPVLVTNFSRLARILWDTKDKQGYLDSLSDIPLLIIDDLAVERDTDYMNEMCYQIVDSRYRTGKPMIITTNLTTKQLKEPVDATHQRIYSRILERCHPVEVAGGNRRTVKMADSYNRMQHMLGLE